MQHVRNGIPPTSCKVERRHGVSTDIKVKLETDDTQLLYSVGSVHDIWTTPQDDLCAVPSYQWEKVPEITVEDAKIDIACPFTVKEEEASIHGNTTDSYLDGSSQGELNVCTCVGSVLLQCPACPRVFKGGNNRVERLNNHIKREHQKDIKYLLNRVREMYPMRPCPLKQTGQQIKAAEDLCSLMLSHPKAGKPRKIRKKKIGRAKDRELGKWDKKL